MFAGAEALVSVSEGNPRSFIGIADSILDRWDGKGGRIDDSIQAAEIKRAADRYAARLAAIPVVPQIATRSLLDVLDKVGDVFHREILSKEFKSDPYGTFIIDPAVPMEIVEALQQAVNAGAILYLPDHNGAAFLDTLYGKRFRLSYLLSPRYRILTRLGKAKDLSRILADDRTDSEGAESSALSSVKAKSGTDASVSQLELGFELEDGE